MKHNILLLKINKMSFDIVGTNVKAQNSLYVQNYSRIGPTTVRGLMVVDKGLQVSGGVQTPDGIEIGTEPHTIPLETYRGQETDDDIDPWLSVNVPNPATDKAVSVDGFWIQSGRVLTLSLNVGVSVSSWDAPITAFTIVIPTLPTPAIIGSKPTYQYVGTCVTDGVTLNPGSVNIVPVIQAATNLIQFRVITSSGIPQLYQVSDKNFYIDLTLSYLV